MRHPAQMSGWPVGFLVWSYHTTGCDRSSASNFSGGLSYGNLMAFMDKGWQSDGKGSAVGIGTKPAILVPSLTAEGGRLKDVLRGDLSAKEPCQRHQVEKVRNFWNIVTTIDYSYIQSNSQKSIRSSITPKPWPRM